MNDEEKAHLQEEIDLLTESINRLNESAAELDSLLLQRANCYKTLEDYKLAVTDYLEVYEKTVDPDNIVHASFMLSSIFLGINDYERSLWWAHEVLEREPYSYEGHLMAGLALNNNNLHQCAEEHLKKALANKNNDKLALRELGIAFLGSGKFNESIHCYEQLIELNSNKASYYHELGMIHYKNVYDKNRNDTAMKYLNKALELSSTEELTKTIESMIKTINS